MQSKMNCYVKEIEQLEKALTRSDKYIEELISTYMQGETNQGLPPNDIGKVKLIDTCHHDKFLFMYDYIGRCIK